MLEAPGAVIWSEQEGLLGWELEGPFFCFLGNPSGGLLFSPVSATSPPLSSLFPQRTQTQSTVLDTGLLGQGTLGSPGTIYLSVYQTSTI